MNDSTVEGDIERPPFSVIVEWDNARLSEADRAREMLVELRHQLAARAGSGRRPEVLVAYDPEEVDRGLIDQILDEASEGAGTGSNAWAADLRVEPAPGLAYYEQKNFGVTRTSGDLVVFLDSDVIPEEGWLDGILAPFDDPEIKLVGGNTYLTIDHLYAQAFALFWFFPLRQRGDGLVQSPFFFANNVAFRRELIEANPFPALPVFRGQCTALGIQLERQGVPLMISRRCRVSHPAPNGWSHFVNRAFCEGHDDQYLYKLRHDDWRAGPLGSLNRYVRHLGFAVLQTLRHGRSVGVGPLRGAGVIGLALVYFTLKLTGELVSHVQPQVIRRNFAV